MHIFQSNCSHLHQNDSLKSQILTFYSDQTGQAKSFVFYNKRDFSLISKIICHCGAIFNVRKKCGFCCCYCFLCVINHRTRKCLQITLQQYTYASKNSMHMVLVNNLPWSSIKLTQFYFLKFII